MSLGSETHCAGHGHRTGGKWPVTMRRLDRKLFSTRRRAVAKVSMLDANACGED